jgi:DNA-binding CsgD family transcriptional regulator
VTKSSQLLETWNREVADVVSSFGDGERLAAAILRMVMTLVPGSFARVSYWDAGGTLVRHHQHPADYALLAATDLNLPDAAFYELDPFILAYREGRSGSMSMWEIAPSGFERSAYYQQAYLAYDYSDLLVHLTQLPGGASIWVELGRGLGKKAFTRAERELHKAIFPAVEVFSARLADLKWGVSGPSSSLGDPNVEGALDRFGADCLTRRERAVTRLVLLGHNTRSVASTLGISPETVRLHRKNVYVKLRVSSQGELFYQFLQSLEARRPPLGPT